MMWIWIYQTSIFNADDRLDRKFDQKHADHDKNHLSVMIMEQ